jgi:hypothetical protein
MRKTFTATFVLLALCLMASVAFAGVTTFPKFKINVPDGWAASEQGPTVVLVANDKSASITITVAATEGMSLKDLAAAFTKELNGSTPQHDSENNAYQFTFKKGAVESNAILSGEGKDYCLLVITGDNPKIQDIIESLEGK